jgi:hypothetical protein
MLYNRLSLSLTLSLRREMYFSFHSFAQGKADNQIISLPLSRLASPHIDSPPTPSSQSRRIAEDRVKKLFPEDNQQPSWIEYAKCRRLRCDLNICLSFKGRWFHTETTKIAVANRPRFRLLIAVAYGFLL